MAGTKSKQRDKQRFRKVYPYIRRKPRLEYVLDKETVIEASSITFTSTDAGSHTFVQSFSSAPVITAISVDSESNNSANVNVFVSSVTTTTLTIKASAPFTGTVHFHAIYIDPSS